MKYSISGNICCSDGTPIIEVINNYSLWRLITDHVEDEKGMVHFTFEAWVNTEADKQLLFSELKPFVDTHTGVIDWHECTHDESQHRPCVIIEEYRR